jgi:hypothetical protein
MIGRPDALTKAPAVLAGAGALATLVVYLATIESQNDPGQLTSGRVLFLAGALGGAGALALAAPIVSPQAVRVGMLDVSAFTLIVLTILGALSIGLLLLIPALCATGAASRASSRLSAFDAMAIAVMAAIAVGAAMALGISAT